MDPNEYRARFGLKRGNALTSEAARGRFQASIHATIEAGGLDAHYAGNAERARSAGLIAAEEKRRLTSEGVSFGAARRIFPEHIIPIVEAIEAGANVSTAVRASPISYTAFHEGLKRHPEYKERVERAKRARKPRPA